LYWDFHLKNIELVMILSYSRTYLCDCRERNSTKTCMITKEMLCQFQPNQNKHNKNVCSHRQLQSTRPSPSLEMTVTSCHYSPVTSSTPNSGYRYVYNNLLRMKCK
jgi:hypothetical protein